MISSDDIVGPLSGKILLAPTGALIVMMCYHISAAAAGHSFISSLSPLMQLMLQVSL